jgi:hypothetical protein
MFGGSEKKCIIFAFYLHCICTYNALYLQYRYIFKHSKSTLKALKKHSFCNMAKVTKTFRFDKDVIDRAKELAKKDNRTLNSYVNHLLTTQFSADHISEIKPISDHNPVLPVTNTIDPKEGALISLFDLYKQDLETKTSVKQIELLVKVINKDVMLTYPEKVKLEAYGKELSKEMYNE